MTKHPDRKADASDLRSYVIGFGVSVVLTFISFWFAPHLGTYAVPLIVLLAVTQLFAQLYFFLHLGREEGSGGNLGMLMFVVAIIGILIVGTLWIMGNLAHLHLPVPTETDLYTKGVVAPQNELK